MSNNTGTGQSGFGSSQTGNDTTGRSPEYRDNLTADEAGGSGVRNQQSTSDWNDTTGGTGDTLGGQGQRTTAAGSGYEADRTGTSYEGSNQEPLSSVDATAMRREATGVGGGSAMSADTSGSIRDAGSRRDMGDNTDGMGRDQTDRVTSDETGTLISADKVQGTAVYDQSGERLGTIDSLMLNKRSGKVAYAVTSFGGFLGIGERYHPLPWDKLTYDTDKGGYNIGLSQDQLRAGPTYSRDELDNFGDDRRSSSDVDDYYGRQATQAGTTAGIGGSGSTSY